MMYLLQLQTYDIWSEEFYTKNNERKNYIFIKISFLVHAFGNTEHCNSKSY